ncbi:type II toxin-antitoxin system RelE/ParE family toxin [Candidatus Woesearchaeota archaeon]|jgi:mRNA-degrading endonuclease RelE of RelBE toxin-antitoxin system|nr:type II toxin-antitoxin system RelE/ParE family toxin [Candidatus Woesearchaeota archaeon]MBT6520020.1 type II toxin-antitoxin system RelE/ParE family toxin [Candidatus Woesearchaeota archaeon]MBT7368603.1 type II toxin-antitoxin system RelE/ParE family toxin [Candidatus Woesearchaeota archaeon]
MVKLAFNPNFKKIFDKINDSNIKNRIIKQFVKIKNNPELGKPMRYSRRGTREVYVKPFRLAYVYFVEENTVVFLNLYHKNEQ